MSKKFQKPRIRIIRLPEVKTYTGLSRSSIYKMIADGKFPTQICLGGRSVGWLESDIQNWIESRVQSRDEVA